jgi:hypothetical protein
MGDPEFRSDEQVLVRTMGIHVKSIPFEGILTSRRIILTDRSKNILPPKEISLATIKSVETGENATGDQILTLSVMAKTGETRQMILTFSRQEGGSRARDEWARIIRDSTSTSFEQVIRKVIPGADQAQKRARPSAPPRIEVVSTPEPQQAETPRTTPVRRVAGGGSPARRIIETMETTPPVAAPAVREFDASSLGENVFCTRCGNPVSADSAFCNRCGSPIGVPASAALHPAPRQPAAPPAAVPRAAAPDDQLRQSLAWDEEPEAEPSPGSRGPAAKPAARKPAGKGFLSGLFGPKKQRVTPPARAQPDAAGTPVPPAKPRKSRSFLPGKKTLIAIGAVIVVILIVAVGALVVYPMLNNGSPSAVSSSSSGASGGSSSGSSTPSSGTLTNTGVASITVKETIAPTVPVTGVFVHVNYIGSWKGTYGMPSDIQTAINSGDRYMEVLNATGPITAAFQKLDSSAKHALTVDIYKNGAVLATGTTSDAFGKVTVSADTGGAAPASSATATSAATGNTTVKTIPATTAAAVKTTAPAANTTTTAH